MPTKVQSPFATNPPDPPDLSDLPMELGGKDPYADPAAVAARAAAARTAGPLPGSPPPRTLPLSPSGKVVSQAVSCSPPIAAVPPPPSESTLASHGAGVVHLHAIGAGGGALAELIGIFKGSAALRDDD